MQITTQHFRNAVDEFLFVDDYKFTNYYNPVTHKVLARRTLSITLGRDPDSKRIVARASDKRLIEDIQNAVRSGNAKIYSEYEIDPFFEPHKHMDDALYRTFSHIKELVRAEALIQHGLDWYRSCSFQNLRILDDYVAEFPKPKNRIKVVLSHRPTSRPVDDGMVRSEIFKLRATPKLFRNFRKQKIQKQIDKQPMVYMSNFTVNEDDAFAEIFHRVAWGFDFNVRININAIREPQVALIVTALTYPELFEVILDVHPNLDTRVMEAGLSRLRAVGSPTNAIATNHNRLVDDYPLTTDDIFDFEPTVEYTYDDEGIIFDKMKSRYIRENPIDLNIKHDVDIDGLLLSMFVEGVYVSRIQFLKLS